MDKLFKADKLDVFHAMNILKTILNILDWVAMMIAIIIVLLFGCASLFFAVHGLVSGLSRQLHEITTDKSDRIFLLIVLLSFIWCGFRWKELNKRP